MWLLAAIEELTEGFLHTPHTLTLTPSDIGGVRAEFVLTLALALP